MKKKVKNEITKEMCQFVEDVTCLADGINPNIVASCLGNMFAQLLFALGSSPDNAKDIFSMMVDTHKKNMEYLDD